MTKQDIQIYLSSIELCNRNGLYLLDEFHLIGAAATKAKSALAAMGTNDVLVIKKATSELAECVEPEAQKQSKK